MYTSKIVKVNRLQRTGDINNVSSGNTLRACRSWSYTFCVSVNKYLVFICIYS